MGGAFLVLHSSELCKERPDGFYVVFEPNDEDDVKVFAQCTFRRKKDAMLAIRALIAPGAAQRILESADHDLEIRKVMCEALQW